MFFKLNYLVKTTFPKNFCYLEKTEVDVNLDVKFKVQKERTGLHPVVFMQTCFLDDKLYNLKFISSEKNLFRSAWSLSPFSLGSTNCSSLSRTPSVYYLVRQFRFTPLIFVCSGNFIKTPV